MHAVCRCLQLDVIQHTPTAIRSTVKEPMHSMLCQHNTCKLLTAVRRYGRCAQLTVPVHARQKHSLQGTVRPLGVLSKVCDHQLDA